MISDNFGVFNFLAKNFFKGKSSSQKTPSNFERIATLTVQKPTCGTALSGRHHGG
jgi:hypothetical protein